MSDNWISSPICYYIFRWKKYLLSSAVSFAILYNIPKYFEMETKVINTKIGN